jgi:glycosyltransferase involved in cell wall biosynthesis
MTFLLIASYPESILNFRKELIESLISARYEVHVAAPGLSTNYFEKSKIEALGAVAHDIPMQRNGTNPIYDLSTLISLWCLIRRIRADLVLAYTIKPILYGMIAARLSGIKQRFALITGLGYSFNKSNTARNSITRYLTRKLYKFSLRKSAVVFFQNNDDKSLFLEYKIIVPTTPSCVVKGSGVNTRWFNTTPLPQTPSFLLIARFLVNKGVREYAEAAKIVKLKHPKVDFCLAGWIDPGPDAIRRSELDSWISNGTLRYLGKLTDVRSAISQSSVYVLPSYREGTPRTVLEAMAMGRAIITTDVPGCRDTITDHYNGRLVAPGNVDSLANAMFYFIENPNLITKMGKRSRQVAMNTYDVHKVNRVMLKKMGIL